MQAVSYCIDLPPLAWKRAGISKSRYYDSQLQDKIDYGLLMLQQHKGLPLLHKGPIELTVTFWMAIPPGRRKELSEGDWHTNVPDSSNLLKHLEDSMKNVTLHDDRYICSILLHKKYSKKPRTEFTLKEL